MTQHAITLPHGRVLLNEAIDGSSEHFVNDMVKDAFVLTYYLKDKNQYETQPLPSGQWQLIGITPLTEEQAAMIAEPITFRKASLYKNHTAKTSDFRDIVESSFTTALESFHSLLTANGVDVSKRWAVLFEPQFPNQ